MLRALLPLGCSLVVGCAMVLGDDFEIVPGPSGGGGAADDACGDGLSCVPPAPAGFSGPVVRATAASPPSCPEGFAAAYSGFAQPSAAPVICAPCSCSTPTVDCVLSPVEAYAALGCAVPPGPVSIAQSTTCGGTMAAQDYGAFQIAPPTANVGACDPQGGGVDMRPEISWSRVLLCAPSATGSACPGGACLPLPNATGFDERYCVFAPGDVECPAPYLEKELVSDGDQDVADTRDCSACSCGPGSGSCVATTRIYGSLNVCNGALKATVPNDGLCHDASNQFANAVELVATIDGFRGSCGAEGGEPEGDVQATGPFTTVCCEP